MPGSIAKHKCQDAAPVRVQVPWFGLHLRDGPLICRRYRQKKLCLAQLGTRVDCAFERAGGLHSARRYTSAQGAAALHALHARASSILGTAPSSPPTCLPACLVWRRGERQQRPEAATPGSLPCHPCMQMWPRCHCLPVHLALLLLLLLLLAGAPPLSSRHGQGQWPRGQGVGEAKGAAPCSRLTQVQCVSLTCMPRSGGGSAWHRQPRVWVRAPSPAQAQATPQVTQGRAGQAGAQGSPRAASRSRQPAPPMPLLHLLLPAYSLSTSATSSTSSSRSSSLSASR